MLRGGHSTPGSQQGDKGLVEAVMEPAPLFSPLSSGWPGEQPHTLLCHHHPLLSPSSSWPVPRALRRLGVAACGGR